jgi:hypothetical protein
MIEARVLVLKQRLDHGAADELARHVAGVAAIRPHRETQLNGFGALAIGLQLVQRASSTLRWQRRKSTAGTKEKVRGWVRFAPE